jgi:hypothetical protein
MMILLLAALLQAEPVWIGKFAGSGDVPAPWKVVPLRDTRPTSYRLASVMDRAAVEARVDRSMAALTRPIEVDLARTPVLCWRWFVDGVVAKGDIRKKSGNDFAARVYVGFDIPDSELGALTKMKIGFARKVLGMSVPDAAVTYVWDNRSSVGTSLKSPYSQQQQIVVAQTGQGEAGQWVSERVDVAADFARAFAGKSGRPVVLAIASDGDNTKSSGRAAFSDIHFVRRNQQCQFQTHGERGRP